MPTGPIYLLLRHSLHLPAQDTDLGGLRARHAFLVGLGIPISFNTWQRVRAMVLHAHPATLPTLSAQALARLLWALHGPAVPVHCTDDIFAAGLQHLQDFLLSAAPADAPQFPRFHPPRRSIRRRTLRECLVTTAHTLAVTQCLAQLGWSLDENLDLDVGPFEIDFWSFYLEALKLSFGLLDDVNEIQLAGFPWFPCKFCCRPPPLDGGL